MKIAIKYLLLGFIACLNCVWVGSLIKCEVLTHQYYDEFKDAYQKNTMLGDMEYFKVLNCCSTRAPDIAQVYYVSKGNTSGHVLTFKYDYNTHSWEEISWSAVWSTSGSASKVIYPYWWHFIYGGF